MSELPKGLLITEGVTVKEGVVKRHSFGNLLESNPELAYGPEVVRADLAAEQIERLENRLFALGAMEKPPCFCCGYNGPNYYHSEVHPCAKRHHKLKEKKT